MANLVPTTWVNSVTPQFATVKCGNITQTATFNTDGSEPVVLGFTDTATWSDVESFTSDNDGLVWTCQTTGIYNLRLNQTYTVESQVDTLSSVTPNTLLYLDIENDTTVGGLSVYRPSGQDSTAVIHAEEAALSDYLIADFTTPEGWLTSGIIPGGDWDLTLTAATSGIASLTTPTQPVYKGQYYKTATQNAPSGTTDVTFNGTASWNNTNGYIAHTDGTADFTVQQAGLYQLEFALYMTANGSTWTVLSKDVAINITRSPIAEQQILWNRFSTASPLTWGNSVVGTIRLQAGDVINCAVTQTVTGTPLIQGLQNTFDYNTTFTFTVIEELPNVPGTGMNSMYFSIVSVDADGVSNPSNILDGASLTPTVINSQAQIVYHIIQRMPPIIINDLTRRIQLKLYVNYETASSMYLPFRGNNVISLQTTLSTLLAPLTADTVNARITVDALTSEFNQVFASSVPISVANGETLTYSSSVNAIANVYRGDTVYCSLVSDQGNVLVTSGQTTLPSPPNTLQWNLIAQGAYGNEDIIVEPMMMMAMEAPIDVPIISELLESFTDESLADALRANLE